MPNIWEGDALYTHYKVSTVSGSPLAVSGTVVTSGNTAVTGTVVVSTTTGTVAVTQNLSIPKYDYVSLSYAGTNLTGVVYKTGGAAGTTVATVALTYDGSNNLTSVTKS